LSKTRRQEDTLRPIQLVEQHIIHRDNPCWRSIDAASFAAKNIYNAANYRVRQAYIREGKYIGYAELDKQFKQADLLPDQQLPSKVVQQVLRQLDSAWQSFFAAREEYALHPDKFTGRPRLPRYRHTTDGRNLLVYVEKAYFKRDLQQGRVRLSGLGVVAQTQQRRIDQVRIVPHKTHYTVEVVYTTAIEPQAHLHPEWVAGGDLGIDTLLALTSNKPGFVPLLVNGRPLKAINQRYNKHCAALQCCLPEQRFTSHQLDAITDKRNWRIKTELHRCSALIIAALVKAGIGTLVIGKNDGWKQEVNMGKRTNQTFVSIPHTQFIQMLTYKAQLAGIKVIVTEESYTSKCSFLDLEPIGRHDMYAGKRVKRSLFRASDGRYIHADVNGAYNILRKVVPNAFADGIGAAVVQPVRVYPRAN
jgi:putative transposase